MEELLQDPEFFKMLFALSGDACYVLDRRRRKYLLVNKAFERLTGYTAEELTSGEIRPSDIVAPEFREQIEGLDEDLRKRGVARLEVEILRKNGKRRWCEATIHNVNYKGYALRIGSLRDVTRRKRLQRQLEHQIELQRKKAVEAARASLRLYQLTEKLRHIPRLAANLMAAETEPQMLKDAAAYLTSRTAFNYAEAAFYIRYGRYLLRMDAKEDPIPTSANDRIARVFRGEKVRSRKRELLLQLRGHRRVLGVLRVVFDPEEYAIFSRNRAALSEQISLVETVADIVALALLDLRLVKRLERLARVDSLTGVFNRRYFERRFSLETDRARRYNRPLSLLLLDMDGLKEINDKCGHAAGDAALKALARLMNRTSRAADAVCRIGGDEFVIILPETALKDALKKAEALQSQVRKLRVECVDKKINLRVSVGVAQFNPNEKPEDFLARADAAMYRAKQEKLGIGVAGGEENGRDGGD
ncbi:MAG: hypothetical protein DRP82_03355 [Planctomycetota bacterium]|nr:MAG: hypothetical protein DRP82_03355 [Planctomycetota bacterium]